jgi:cytochrome c553
MRRLRMIYLGLSLLSAGMSLAQARDYADQRRDYFDLRRIHAVQGDAAAGRQKGQVCFACHGENGVSVAPIFPNLAGQSAEYLYWQLVEYKRARRPPSTMTPLAQPLSEGDMRDLATYFASVKRGDAAGGATGPGATTAVSPTDAASDGAPATDPKQIASGLQLFQNGNASKGIPPCQGCHGADALGNPLAREPPGRASAYYRTYPALRGQKAQYLVTRLTDYREGHLMDSSNNFIMRGVASRLDDDSIQAVAAWLDSLPSR